MACHVEHEEKVNGMQREGVLTVVPDENNIGLQRQDPGVIAVVADACDVQVDAIHRQVVVLGNDCNCELQEPPEKNVCGNQKIESQKGKLGGMRLKALIRGASKHSGCWQSST